MIWAIKDKSIGATFFDAGAAHFFIPCLKENKQEENKPCKRLRYTIDGMWCGFSTFYSSQKTCEFKLLLLIADFFFFSFSKERKIMFKNFMFIICSNFCFNWLFLSSQVKLQKNPL